MGLSYVCHLTCFNLFIYYLFLVTAPWVFLQFLHIVLTYNYKFNNNNVIFFEVSVRFPFRFSRGTYYPLE